MRILYLTHHWGENSHHASRSGYQELIKYVSKRHKCSVVTYHQKAQVRVESGIEVHYIKPLMKRDYFFVRRLQISWYASRIERNFDVVHALYSDCGFFQNHPNFFSTVHISPFISLKEDLWSRIFLRLKYNFIEKRVFRKSRKIFLVSSNLMSGLDAFGYKAIFLPHGVNTGFWAPNVLSSSPEIDFQAGYVLCVGNNGVDREELLRIIEQHPGIRFIVVGLRGFAAALQNVTVLYGVSDERLRALYENCICFIRPSTFATANNAVLEALSMNKPVLISTEDGKYEYFGNSSAYQKCVAGKYFGDAFREFFESCKRLEKSGQDCGSRELALRNFDWEVIQQRLEGFYTGESGASDE